MKPHESTDQQGTRYERAQARHQGPAADLLACVDGLPLAELPQDLLGFLDETGLEMLSYRQLQAGQKLRGAVKQEGVRIRHVSTENSRTNQHGADCRDPGDEQNEDGGGEAGRQDQRQGELRQ